MRVGDFMEAPKRMGKHMKRSMRDGTSYRAARRKEAKQIYRVVKRSQKGN